MGLVYILEHQGRNYGADVTEIGLVSLSFRPCVIWTRA